MRCSNSRLLPLGLAAAVALVGVSVVSPPRAIAGGALSGGALSGGALSGVAVSGTTALQNVACSGVGACEAVGSNASGQGVIVGIGHNGPGSVGVVSGTTVLYGDVCPSNGGCEAVGRSSSGQGVVVPITSAGAGAVTAVPGTAVLVAVACSAVGSCEAVGVNSSGQGVIVGIGHNGPGSVGAVAGTTVLNGVSCPANGFCEAVGQNSSGQGVIVPITSAGAGTVQVVPGTTALAGISCTSSSSCEVVGYNASNQGVVLPITSGGAGSARVVPGTTALIAVSCPSAGSCVGAGFAPSGLGVVVPITAYGPGATQEVSATQFLYGVACPSTSGCEAVGGNTTPQGVVTAVPGPPAGCGYATGGSGAHEQTICWLDMTGYSSTNANPAGPVTRTISLPGGYTMSYTLTDTLPDSSNFLGAAALGNTDAVALPTFPGVALGGTWYTGVPGAPALYMLNNNGGSGPDETQLNLTGITVKDPAGNPVTNYRLVVANAEATGPSEEDIFTSDKPLNLLEEAGSTTTATCWSTLVGVGTTTVSCGYPSSAAVPNNGNPILVAQAPTTVSAKLITNGGEAVAFGVQIPTTTTTLSAAPNPSALLQTVNLTADVNAFAPGCTSGTVAFSTGNTTLGTANTSNGVATLNTSRLPLGNDTVTAKFTPTGSTDCVGSSGTTTHQVDLIIISLSALEDLLNALLPGIVPVAPAATSAQEHWNCTPTDDGKNQNCTRHLDHKIRPGETLPDIDLPVTVQTPHGPQVGHARLAHPSAPESGKATPETLTVTDH